MTGHTNSSSAGTRTEDQLKWTHSGTVILITPFPFLEHYNIQCQELALGYLVVISSKAHQMSTCMWMVMLFHYSLTIV